MCSFFMSNLMSKFMPKPQPTIVKFLLLLAIMSLSACANNSSSTSTETSSDPSVVSSETVASPATEATAPTAETSSATDHSAPRQGGQVVETEKYHMEFVPIPEAEGIHLDFYLQTGDDHASIDNANVIAQVQLPDGSQQEVPMEYDAAGAHYFAFLPSQATGEYKVVVLTDFNGEKANGRFTFTK